MTSTTGLMVLQRVASGETLHHLRGKTYFYPRRGGWVHPRLVATMAEAGLLAAWEDEFVVTAAGQELLIGSSEPVMNVPMPSLKWFKRIARKIDGLGDVKLEELPDADQCWLWKGPRNTEGYPKTSVNNKTVLLGRFLYELKFGPLPKSARLKNKTCTFIFCVNPMHWVDDKGWRYVDTDERILARIKLALVRGDDKAALQILADLRGSKVVDEAPREEFKGISVEEAMELVEDAYGQFQFQTFDELWSYFDDLGLCPKDTVLEAIKRIGGAIERRLSP